MPARRTVLVRVLFILLACSLPFLSSEATSPQDSVASAEYAEQGAVGVAERPRQSLDEEFGPQSAHGAPVPLEKHAASKGAAMNKQLSSSLPVTLAAITFLLLMLMGIVRRALTHEGADEKETRRGRIKCEGDSCRRV
ncbi:hypothetical protein Esti_000735 [Eimeria stiedai]